MIFGESKEKKRLKSIVKNKVGKIMVTYLILINLIFRFGMKRANYYCIPLKVPKFLYPLRKMGLAMQKLPIKIGGFLECLMIKQKRTPYLLNIMIPVMN